MSTRTDDRAHARIPSQTTAMVGLVALLAAAQPWLVTAVTSRAVQSWCTIFVAVVIQALPFLVLGVVLSGAIAALPSERLLTAALPRRSSFAVPVAGLAGAALPGCECASVPVAGSLIRRGVTPAAAVTFLLAAPAINPVVLVTTSVAFPGRPEMVAARFVASLLASVSMGWLWLRVGARIPVRLSRSPHHHGASRLTELTMSVRHDFLHAGGFLVLGAMVAAAVNAFVPLSVIDTIGARPLAAVLALATFAVLVAMCSEADAFVAASLTAFSDTAKLAFLVVGPAVDIKLAALQAGSFGKRFAAVFAPTTFVVAVGSAVVVARLLL